MAQTRNEGRRHMTNPSQMVFLRDGAAEEEAVAEAVAEEEGAEEETVAGEELFQIYLMT